MVPSWTPRSGSRGGKPLFKKGIYKYSVSTKNELKASIRHWPSHRIVLVSTKNELKGLVVSHMSFPLIVPVSTKNELKAYLVVDLLDSLVELYQQRMNWKCMHIRFRFRLIVLVSTKNELKVDVLLPRLCQSFLVSTKNELKAEPLQKDDQQALLYQQRMNWKMSPTASL